MGKMQGLVPPEALAGETGGDTEAQELVADEGEVADGEDLEVLDDEDDEERMAV